MSNETEDWRRGPASPAAVEGMKIKSVRLAKGISQSKLAETAGLSQRRLSRLESGKRPNPRMRDIEKIARALDVPPGLLSAGKASDSSAPAKEPGPGEAIDPHAAAAMAFEAAFERGLPYGKQELPALGEALQSAPDPSSEDQLRFLAIPPDNNPARAEITWLAGELAGMRIALAEARTRAEAAEAMLAAVRERVDKAVAAERERPWRRRIATGWRRKSFAQKLSAVLPTVRDNKVPFEEQVCLLIQREIQKFLRGWTRLTKGSRLWQHPARWISKIQYQYDNSEPSVDLE